MCVLSHGRAVQKKLDLLPGAQLLAVITHPGETLIVYFSSTTLGPQCYSKDQAHQLSKQFAIFTFYQTKTLMFIG